VRKIALMLLRGKKDILRRRFNSWLRWGSSPCCCGWQAIGI